MQSGVMIGDGDGSGDQNCAPSVCTKTQYSQILEWDKHYFPVVCCVLSLNMGISDGVCFRFSCSLLSFFVIFVVVVHFFSFSWSCEFLWKNDKSFKVPNAINQDCFRSLFCCCIQMMVLIMFESKVTYPQQKHCYRPHHFHQSICKPKLVHVPIATIATIATPPVLPLLLLLLLPCSVNGPVPMTKTTKHITCSSIAYTHTPFVYLLH